jgi:hypothetical protein
VVSQAKRGGEASEAIEHRKHPLVSKKVGEYLLFASTGKVETLTGPQEGLWLQQLFEAFLLAKA